MARRRAVDVEAFVERIRSDRCAMCRIVSGEAVLPNPIGYEDEASVAWVSPYQTQLGYTIVAPREHRVAVTGETHRGRVRRASAGRPPVGEAVRRAVPTERLYVLSLGSVQGNAHVHWHLVPLPPGVPYEEQQLVALDWERCGVLACRPRTSGLSPSGYARSSESLPDDLGPPRGCATP